MYRRVSVAIHSAKILKQVIHTRRAQANSAFRLSG